MQLLLCYVSCVVVLVAVAQLCDQLKERYQHISLLVSDNNHTAIRVYKVGTLSLGQQNQSVQWASCYCY